VPIKMSLLSESGKFEEVGSGVTDADGRCGTLLPATVHPENVGFKPGTYQIRFELQAYFDANGTDAFYPFAEVRVTL
jgi:5-hydroxyisourate hydrolase-like protein (transthyretin family)